MDDNEFRDLQERSALVAEVAASPGWEMLVDRARHTLAAHQQRVINGNMADFSEYQKEVGYIDGILFVLFLPSKVAQELEEELAFREEVKAMEEEDAALA